MENLKGSSRKYLRGLAHHLHPVVIIGKMGLTEALLNKVDNVLENHELIKVKFGEHKEKKKSFAEEISSKTQSEIVGMIGHMVILYRQHPDEGKRKIKIPKNLI